MGDVMRPGPSRYATLVPATGLEAWQRDALLRIPPDAAHEMLQITVTDDPDGRAAPASLGNRLLTWYRRRRLDRPGHALHRPPAPVGTPTRLRLRPNGVRALPEDAVEALSREGCDLVVNFSGHAVASPADIDMWEFRWCPGEHGRLADLVAPLPVVVRLALVHVGRGGQPDRTLREGWVHTTPHSLSATLHDIHSAGIEWLRSAICAPADAAAGAPPTTADLRGRRMAPVIAGFLLQRVRWAVRQTLRQEEWHLGVVERPVDEVYRQRTVEPVTWLPSPSRRFYLADPFGLDDAATILAERYDYLRRRGEIAAVRVAGDGRPHARPTLPSPGHTSYPYLFRHDHGVYCVPETNDQHRATLYRATAYPWTWERVCTIGEGLAVTDPTVFQHDGRWWMLCTDNDLGPGSNLHAFYAPRLDGPWTPHALNPVKVDIRSARPAGAPFVVDGALIRPAQTHERGYGSGIVFNRVEVLTPSRFRERPVAKLRPRADGEFRHGLHTINAWGDRTLVDGKRRGPSVTNLVGRVLNARS